MGQYYRTIVKRESDGEIHIFDGGDFEDFIPLKLCEHSWIGNYWADYIAHSIYLTPCRVAHVGDYANPEEDTNVNEKLSDWYSLRNDKKYKAPYKDEGEFDYKDKYLINHDQKCYIDLNKYIEQCKVQEDDWICNPITLLTAVGNGKGGGDFTEEDIGYEDIGTWAGDLIEISYKKPDYTEEDEYKFICVC